MTDLATDSGRPLQARAVRTRMRLLEATIACLIELGYAGTTTTAVAKRAGVSQGALYKHFPTKTALLTATIEHLFADLIAGYRSALGSAIATQDDRVGAACQMLWLTFRSPTLQAAYELYLAARTDHELRDALGPVLRAHRANILAEASRLFPDVAPHPRFPAIIDGVVSTLQGAAITAMVLPPEELGELAFVEHVARESLTTALAELSMESR